MSTLNCQMDWDCKAPIKYIDDKGFIYCRDHGLDRKLYRRCRQLDSKELKLINAGQPIASYRKEKRVEA